MASLQVLVVDDETAIRQVLASQIGKAGHGVEHVGTGLEAVDRLLRGDVDLCICDIRLPDIDGIEVIRRTRSAGIETTFLMITAYASVNTAIEAMKAGAFEYLIKPLRQEDILHRVEQVEQINLLREENQRLRRMVPPANADACTQPSAAMRQVDQMIAKVARTNGTVLITGESGTGKGVVARAVHEQSRCADKAFVSVNCGAIPETLLESEFFGHLKGAFTGADRAKKGLFREADGGTLFLDEIGELPLELQVKLLHVIEEKEVRPVGSEQSRKVDVRIISATNRNVRQMVAEGKLREDLFYRLNVLHIHLPPLRDRPDDIAPMIRCFLRRESQRLGLERELGLDPEAERMLAGYHWPGNLREMQNVIARALVLTEGDTVTVADLPHNILAPPSAPAGKNHADRHLRDQVREFEYERIRAAIDAEGGDRQAAAARLGIGLSTLYRKLDEFEARH
jgi:two-component system response regulator AtoC